MSNRSWLYPLTGVVFVALVIASFTLGDEPADPGAVQALSALWNNDFVPFAMGLLLFLWGFGAAIVRHGALPKWMGWVAIVAGITAVSPAFFVRAIVALLLVVARS